MQSKFEEFWAAYPKRDGANPRKPAYAKFIGHWKSGADPDRIIAGAREYHSQLAAKGQVGSPYVAQATTWLNQQRWEDHLAPKQSTRAEQLAEEAKQILAERLRRKANAQTAATAGTNGHHVDHPGELLVEGRAVYPDGDLFPRSGTDDPSWH